MKKKILFNKKDYKILIVGLIFIATGFILMSGGGSDDPNIFNDEIYNFRRIRLSPTLVIFGFVIIFFSILRKKKKYKKIEKNEFF